MLRAWQRFALTMCRSWCRSFLNTNVATVTRCASEVPHNWWSYHWIIGGTTPTSSFHPQPSCKHSILTTHTTCDAFHVGHTHSCMAHGCRGLTHNRMHLWNRHAKGSKEHPGCQHLAHLAAAVAELNRPHPTCTFCRDQRSCVGPTRAHTSHSRTHV